MSYESSDIYNGNDPHTITTPEIMDSSESFFVSRYYYRRRRRYRRYYRKKSQEDIFIQAEGGIGIGFYDVPSGATKGGMNVNVDIIPFDLKYIHLGLTAGYLNIMNSKLTKQEDQPNDPDTGLPVDPIDVVTETTITAYPLHIMFIKFFRSKNWNSIPYFHISPGMYTLEKKINDDTKYTFGYGASTGIGLLVPISKMIYINLGVRFHWIMESMKEQPEAPEDAKYMVLSSIIGVSSRW